MVLSDFIRSPSFARRPNTVKQSHSHIVITLYLYHMFFLVGFVSSANVINPEAVCAQQV